METSSLGAKSTWGIFPSSTNAASIRCGPSSGLIHRLSRSHNRIERVMTQTINNTRYPWSTLENNLRNPLSSPGHPILTSFVPTSFNPNPSIQDVPCLILPHPARVGEDDDFTEQADGKKLDAEHHQQNTQD